MDFLENFYDKLYYAFLFLKGLGEKMNKLCFILIVLIGLFNSTFFLESTENFKNNHFEEGFLTFFDDKDEQGEYDDMFFATNAYPCPIELFVDGEPLVFSCSENAYHAMKYYPNIDIMRLFSGDIDGFEGYRLSRNPILRKKIPTDWYPEKAVIAMLQILRIKFSHPDMEAKLLATRDAYLVEHWPNRMSTQADSFWADGRDGSGQNQMGCILMYIRGELGGTSEVPPPYSYFEWVALSAY